MADKEYELKVDPKILKFLGPTLYTNIYYVLAELIANAYDANAHNVYIIEEDDAITVEDDGNGMSYEEDIKKYLDVATETRTTKDEEFVEGSNNTRRKLGRKGIGKLAALSVSDKVLVKTKKNGDYSGFILLNELPEDNKLPSLPREQITFTRVVEEHGTSIVMTKPTYKIHATKETVKTNLLKILPLVSQDFKLHIKLKRGSEFIVDRFETNLIKQLGALITLGNEFHYLADSFKPGLNLSEEKKHNLLKKRESTKIKLTKLQKRDGQLSDYILEIKGWVGVLESTKDRRLNPADFPDNFLSIISNGKLGIFNIIPDISKNKLSEVYVVGQLHVDLLEETDLQDMALSNRQGYKSEDKRFIALSKEIGENLLPEIVGMRNTWVKYKNEKKNQEKLEKQKAIEEELRLQVKTFQDNVAKQVAEAVGGTSEQKSANEEIVQKKLGDLRQVIGIKKKADEQKKRILISHARCDKTFAHIIEKMLIFNNVPSEDILYTSSDNIESLIPEVSLLDYLKLFFIDSISDKKIAVAYVTSKKMSEAWFPVLEVGAAWITGSRHKVFNLRSLEPSNPLDSFKPSKPLDVDTAYQTSFVDYDTNAVSTEVSEFNRFILKIRDFCTNSGYTPRSEEENKTELARHLSLKSA